MKTDYPILLLDDEYADISDLEHVLANAAIRAGHPRGITVYCESCEEALDIMKYQKRSNKGISAIISDNHIGTSEIDGDDFLRIIRGNLLYCYSGFVDDAYMRAEHFKDLSELKKYSGRTNAPLDRFFEENFKDLKNYVDFYRYYYPSHSPGTPAILLCGNLREANLDGLMGIQTFGKDTRYRASKSPCELDVLDTLMDLGLFELDELDYGLKKNRRLSHPDPKRRIFNPCANTIRKRIRDRNKDK